MTYSYFGVLLLGFTSEKAESVEKGLRLLLELISPHDVLYGLKFQKSFQQIIPLLKN